MNPVSWPRFLKHFVLAGAAFSPRPDLLRRGLGAAAWYWDFLRPIAAGADRFGEPAPILRDPTLKAHFSNLAGRALADLLVRKFEGALVTLSYEGAMLINKLPIQGSRPDLLAVAPGRVVAVEAKGYSKRKVSAAEMARHKLQARGGPLRRDSWAASVGQNLYRQAEVQYVDPEDESPRPTPTFTAGLLANYFRDLAETVVTQEGRAREIDGELFISLTLPDVLRGAVPADVLAADELNRITLLLSARSAERAYQLRSIVPSGINAERETSEASVDSANAALEAILRLSGSVIERENLFVDRDGIGISTAG